MNSKDENVYRMARRINDPPTLILWPVHWVLPIFMAVGAALVMGNIILFLALGFGWFFTVKTVEAKYPPGHLTHLVWWKAGTCPGFIDDDTISVPNPLRREFTQL